MDTIIEKYSPEAVKKAGEIIRKGGLVAFPTETVYGLGANALDSEAASKIYSAKGRPSDNPLIVHIAQIESLSRIAEDIPESAVKLAGKFWPGPLTMIFKKKPVVPMGTTGGLDTVAVRMPNHEAALDIIRSGGGFIAAPSANTSGRPSPTCAEHVIEDMSGIIDMIIDGGPVPIGVESTIVDMTEAVPMILRPGYITPDDIKGITGSVSVDPGIISKPSEDVRPKAPGMRYRHYAPKASMAIVDGDNEKVVSYINKRIAELTVQGKKCGVISSKENKNLYKCDIIPPDPVSEPTERFQTHKTCVIIKDAGSGSEEAARNLFRILREFDAEDVDMIFSESFNEGQISTAVMNRLLKAAGYNVVYV